MSFGGQQDQFPHSYTLRTTIEDRELYAGVYLELIPTEQEGIMFDPQNPLEKWHNDSAEFGINYAWEMYLRTNTLQGGYNVRFATQGLSSPESTPGMMAYAGALAMYEALDFKPDSLPSIDNKQVSFPL